MATMPQRREVELDSDLKCPVCENPIPVMTIIDVVQGTSRLAGSRGFRQPVVSVSLETKIIGFKIHHECDYTKPED